MKKITLKGLFLASLVLAFAFVLPTGFVKAEDADQAEVNENQAEINKNQAEINKNQAEINKNQNAVNKGQSEKNDDNDDQDDKNLNGADHRSAVATFVQNLLETADRAGGIGEEVRAIAQEQNDSKEDVAEKIDAINDRSGFKTFFIGTDYKNLGDLRSETVKTANQIERLTRLLEGATGDIKADLEDQIDALKDEQEKILDFIDDNDSKFSLFGWFVKLFQ